MEFTADAKQCSVCKYTKPTHSFSRDRSRLDGCSGTCKDCKRSYDAKYNTTRRTKARPTPSSTASDMSDTEPPTLPDTGSTVHDTLYVMRYEFDPCGTMGLKIGRAADVPARARQLGASHNFRMHVLATFTGWGFLETRVHAILAANRATGGSGREWFDVPLDSALSVIAVAMRTERASTAN